ncbi:MAG: DUF1638 domain-containing protein [Nitrospirota bacterium]
MRFLVIACKIFEREINKMLGDGHGHSIVMLDFGYHKMPFVLQQRIQAIIDNASDVDAILLLYGYCGGTLKLDTADLPVVMPKAHDCFDMMLGSNERFSLFSDEPGTYFLSEGWVRRDGTPFEKVRGARKRLKDDDDKIIEEMYSGYKRLLFVRTGIETEESILRARRAATEMGWQFEEKIADLPIMKKLFSEEWDSDFIVMNPQ